MYIWFKQKIFEKGYLLESRHHFGWEKRHGGLKKRKKKRPICVGVGVGRSVSDAEKKTYQVGKKGTYGLLDSVHEFNPMGTIKCL